MPQIYQPFEDRKRPIFKDLIVLVPSSFVPHHMWHAMEPYRGEINFIDDYMSLTPMISNFINEQMFHSFYHLSGSLTLNDLETGQFSFTTEEDFHTYPNLIGDLSDFDDISGEVTPDRGFIPQPSPCPNPMKPPGEIADTNPSPLPSKPSQPYDPEECVKKYHSSIFDANTDIIIKEEPITPSGKRFSSDANPNRKSTQIVIRDSLEPVTVHALDIWAKILSSGILYNYAAAIAVEEKENYSVETELDV